jgi:hypothetical protein
MQDPLREAVVVAAKRFKAGWAELGRLLVQVRDEALFEKWGYPTFDAYCAKEIHVRKATAEKLTRTFSFLARHEPKTAETPDLAARAPAFEVVEVLADAEERGQLSPREYQAVRESIWGGNRPTAELRRELQERFPRPAPEPGPQHLQLRRLAQSARRLADELSAFHGVPRRVADEAVSVAEAVEALAEKLHAAAGPVKQRTGS